MTLFNPYKYTSRYYYRHLVQYREYENAIGENIVRTLVPSSILDLGCGVGSYLEGALKAGCKDVLGMEISFDTAQKYFVDEIRPYIQKGDITEKLELGRTFDCVMSIEAAEHIEPAGTDTFIDNLTGLSSRYVLLTAAPPKQKGTGHINRREKQFWLDAIQAKGFEYQKNLTDGFIGEWEKIGAPWFLLINLMVFEKS